MKRLIGFLLLIALANCSSVTDNLKTEIDLIDQLNQDELFVEYIESIKIMLIESESNLKNFDDYENILSQIEELDYEENLSRIFKNPDAFINKIVEINQKSYALKKMYPELSKMEEGQLYEKIKISTVSLLDTNINYRGGCGAAYASDKQACDEAALVGAAVCGLSAATLIGALGCGAAVIVGHNICVRHAERNYGICMTAM